MIEPLDIHTVHVEVQLPLRLSAKWVAYACRTAGVAKPKWNPIREIWTTTTTADDGVEERVAITGSGENVVRIKIEWGPFGGLAAETRRQTPTARRIISAIVTSMQWAVRRQADPQSERLLHFR